MKKKRLIIISQYFPPEIGGGSVRSYGFAEELHKLGLDIIVVTPFPSYLISGAKNKYKFYEMSFQNGMTIYRTFVYASDRSNFMGRIFYYLSFTFSSLWFILLKLDSIDYILTISPPLFTGITGVWAKKLKSAKLIFDIGDLWPESAILLGFLKNKIAIYLSTKLEKYVYRNSDYINVTTKQTLAKITEQNPFIRKVFCIPNFVDTSKFLKVSKCRELISKYHLENKLVFGYAGNIGSAQGLKIITEAANLTRDLIDVVYFIIGDGVERKKILEEIQKNNLTNIILIPSVQQEQIRDYISVFDVIIIPLLKNELFRITIPSKLYEAMASEKMVIISVDGEARKIVEESNCGIYVEPEDSQMLADKIRTIAKDRNLIVHLGKNGRKVVEEQFDRKLVITGFFNSIMSNE